MPNPPDLAEIEISLVGRFFRPPLDEVGFRPLDDFLDRRDAEYQGLRKWLVESRLAPWQKQGVTFGIPHDVHPCTITYRDDLFRKAGIDLSQATTWPKFHDAVLRFEQYWRSRDSSYRHAFDLPESSSEFLQTMLLHARHQSDRQLRQGPDRRPAGCADACAVRVDGGRAKVHRTVAAGLQRRHGRDVTDGNLCAFITPDWWLTYLKTYGAAVAGSMRMMPMPVFDATDTPTSMRGGTMMGRTRASRNPQLAWKLLQYLYFSEDGIRARQAESDILPPMRLLELAVLQPAGPVPRRAERRGDVREARRANPPPVRDPDELRRDPRAQ